MSQVPREGPEEELAHEARDSQPQVTKICARERDLGAARAREHAYNAVHAKETPSRPCATNNVVSTYQMPVAMPVCLSQRNPSRCRAR